MSLPPGVVQLKRRRSEQPIEYLHIEESGSSDNKKRRITDYVFSRQPSLVEQTVPFLPFPATRPIKQPRGVSVTTKSKPRGVHNGGVAVDQAGVLLQDTASAQQAPNQTNIQNTQRSFYISRTAVPLAGGKRKAPNAPIVFSERRPAIKRSREASPSLDQVTTLTSIPSTETTRPLKKPGLHARTKPLAKSVAPAVTATPPPTTATFNIQAPSGAILPWDVDSEQLAAEMQAYTLAEITRTMKANEAATPPTPIKVERIPPSPSRFKPRAPKQRYHERHPEEAAANFSQTVEAPQMSDEDEEMLDDSEYIIETYVRMSADTIMAADLDKEHNFGLLVLDGEADIEEFYRDGEEDSDEDEEDEEDENAENHYSADYPDEGIDSDDEYGGNPYAGGYSGNRYGNEFEDEDSDVDSVGAFSGDEDERYPWNKR